LKNFQRIWGERKKTRAIHADNFSTPSSSECQDPGGVVLSLSRRLLAVGKLKKILNLETGLEMIACGIAICSEVEFLIVLKTF
jgi:hypothetical protein